MQLTAQLNVWLRHSRLWKPAYIQSLNISSVSKNAKIKPFKTTYKLFFHQSEKVKILLFLLVGTQQVIGHWSYNAN